MFLLLCESQSGFHWWCLFFSKYLSSLELIILLKSLPITGYFKQGYLAERLKSSFRKFYGRYGDLSQQYEVSLSRMLNDILILDQQWLPNQSDFPPISWPWYRAWPSPIMSGFHGAFATGVACQQGTLYPSGHLVPSPILGLANAPIVETKFLELAMALLDFSPRIPLGTFSILLLTNYTSNSYATIIVSIWWIAVIMPSDQVDGYWPSSKQALNNLVKPGRR